MLFHSIKQYAIILSTSFFPFNSLTLLFLLKLRIFTKKIRFNNNNDSEAASMFHVVHLIHVFFLLVRKRSVELCKRENKACLQD